MSDVPTSPPTVLFLTSNTEDYFSNSPSTGRAPRRAHRRLPQERDLVPCTYPHLDRIYGRGFTLYGLLGGPFPLIDRTLVLDRARQGAFDLIVFGDIWRYFGCSSSCCRTSRRLTPRVSRRRRLSGAVSLRLHFLARAPRWMAAAGSYARGLLQRELTDETAHRRYFMVNPKRLAARLPFGARASADRAFHSEEKIVAEPPAKTKPFNAHVVDAEVAERIGASGSYAFEREAEYYADLQASRFGITAKDRPGCAPPLRVRRERLVPCFRQLERKPLLYAPHGLEPGGTASATTTPRTCCDRSTPPTRAGTPSFSGAL